MPDWTANISALRSSRNHLEIAQCSPSLTLQNFSIYTVYGQLKPFEWLLWKYSWTLTCERSFHRCINRFKSKFNQSWPAWLNCKSNRTDADGDNTNAVAVCHVDCLPFGSLCCGEQYSRPACLMHTANFFFLNPGILAHCRSLFPPCMLQLYRVSMLC